MPGKTIVITGASDGIGAAAARALRAEGHQVVLVGRSAEKTRAIAAELGTDYFVADFAKLSEVRNLARQLSAAYPRIDVLANNAGGAPSDRSRTVDGFDLTLQVNHLAPFLLTNLLIDVLISSTATVIMTSSSAAKMQGAIDMEAFRGGEVYDAGQAYTLSKLANILFAKELQRRFGGVGLNAVSFNPGVVATGFASDGPAIMRLFYRAPLKWLSPDDSRGRRQGTGLAR